MNIMKLNLVLDAKKGQIFSDLSDFLIILDTTVIIIQQAYVVCVFRTLLNKLLPKNYFGCEIKTT